MEKELLKFKEEGFCIIENQDLRAHELFKETLCKSIDVSDMNLGNIHHFINKSDINNSRLKAFSSVNSLELKSELYFKQAEKYFTESIKVSPKKENSILLFDDLK